MLLEGWLEGLILLFEQMYLSSYVKNLIPLVPCFVYFNKPFVYGNVDKIDRCQDVTFQIEKVI